MYKILLFVLVFFLCVSSLFSQNYLTIGFGYSLAFYQSEDLTKFRNTYNWVYATRLATPMRGLTEAAGIRIQVGYRYHGRYHAAVISGYSHYKSEDMGKFSNTEIRELDLNVKSIFTEFEIGPKFKKFLLNGLISLHFSRKLTLDSKYSIPGATETTKALNGNYQGDSFFSCDFGVSVGIFKDPVILLGKLFYPLYTSGSSNFFKDESPNKLINETSIFPDDYSKYLFDERGPYKGIGSDINGFKILITLSVAFEI